jgi:hypothetical protein
MRPGARLGPVSALLCLLVLALALTATSDDGRSPRMLERGATRFSSAEATGPSGVSGGDVRSREAASEAPPVASGTEREVPASEDTSAAGLGGGSSSKGELELHSLTAWDAPEDGPSVYLSFTPISMEEFFGGVPFVRRVLAGEEIEVADCAPELTSSLVDVDVDGVDASVRSLEWYYAGYGDLTGTDTKYMPVCVMRVDRPKLAAGEHRVDVRVTDARTGAIGLGRTTFVSRPTRERL